MISGRNYFTIFILIIIVFVIFMFAGVYTDILSGSPVLDIKEAGLDIGLSDTLNEDILNLDKDLGSGERYSTLLDPSKKTRVAVISQGDDSLSNILTSWCIYNKFFYFKYNELPPEEELGNYDLLLFGDFHLGQDDLDILESFAEKERNLIFTQLPPVDDIIYNRPLADFFGIKEVLSRNVEAQGIRIFSDFFMSRERIYREDDYFGEEDDTIINLPYYRLWPGYKVFALGILEDQKEAGVEDWELPPILWRTYKGKSHIYAVNGDVFEDLSLLGVLTGFMADQGECFLYPIINAMTISLVNYPYFSDENHEAMEGLYSRRADAVSRDILWPNILQILKNYRGSYNFFAAPQLDYGNPMGSNYENLDFYLNEIAKLPGIMGLSLGQISDKGLDDILEENEEFFSRERSYTGLRTLYSGNFDLDDLREGLEGDFLKDVSLVMSDYRGDGKLMDFIDEKTLYVGFNQDGFRHETRDDISMISLLNSLGMCNVKVNLDRAFFPKSREDEWNLMSLKWSKGDTYFKEFSMLDMVSVMEMDKRVRSFLALDFAYELRGDVIDLKLNNFENEAFFILNTHNRRIEKVDNGQFDKISDYTYMIKAEKAELKIYTKEENILMPPKNGKLIPRVPTLTPEEE